MFAWGRRGNVVGIDGGLGWTLLKVGRVGERGF
jgi:hypothetical protein